MPEQYLNDLSTVSSSQASELKLHEQQISKLYSRLEELVSRVEQLETAQPQRKMIRRNQQENS